MTDDERKFEMKIIDNFEKCREIIKDICENDEIHKKLKHNLCISLIGVMIIEAGDQLYPYFTTTELHVFFSRLENCIDNVAEIEEEDVVEEEDLSIITLVNKCNEMRK